MGERYRRFQEDVLEALVEDPAYKACLDEMTDPRDHSVLRTVRKAFKLNWIGLKTSARVAFSSRA